MYIKMPVKHQYTGELTIKYSNANKIIVVKK